jgi:WD40 repeat protein
MARLFGTLTLAVCAALALPVPVRAQPSNRTEATALLFRPDGKTLLSTGLHGYIRAWDVVTGKESAQVVAHKDGVWGAALSGDGKYLATAGEDGLVRLWDAKTLKPLRTFAGHTKEAVAVAFSPDGKTLASGGGDRTVRLWDVATGKQLRFFHGHELKVTGLAWSPDGKTLASAGTASPVLEGVFIRAVHADQVRLWDPTTGKEIRKLPLRATAVAFAPDGQTLASGGLIVTRLQGGGRAIQGRSQTGVSDLAGKERVLAQGQGGAPALSADGKFLAVAWGTREHLGRSRFENHITSNQASLWELASGKEVLRLAEANAPVVAISPDGTKVAVGRQDGTVGFVELTPSGWGKGKAVPELTGEEFDRRWQALAGENPAAAYEALWALAQAGDKAAALLGARLEPARAAGPRAKQLLADLNHKRFAVREAAFRELKKLGTLAEADLREALKGTVSAEVRARVQLLLGQCGAHPATPEERRQTRALQILERIASREARQVLARLADGAPGAWLTGEARAALARLKRRADASR